MNNTTTIDHAMTLRLDATLAEALENTAFELRISQAAFVRRAIRWALEHTRPHEWPARDRETPWPRATEKRTGRANTGGGGEQTCTLQRTTQ